MIGGSMGAMETKELVLTLQDRCDRCGAEAKAELTTPRGGKLLFCGHDALALPTTEGLRWAGGSAHLEGAIQ